MTTSRRMPQVLAGLLVVLAAGGCDARAAIHSLAMATDAWAGLPQAVTGEQLFAPVPAQPQ